MEKKKTILLVDDSSTTLMMERLLLARAPYELIVARDGREAVAKATSDHPDLILMDVVMPNMNGIDACRALRAQESTRSIPIIMVTTRSEAETMERGFASGCNDYVTKPIDAVELLAKLRDQLGE